MSPSKPIRVLVADANRMASEMLARTLSQGHGQFKVVASVCDSPGVTALLAEKAVDVVLLSVELADGPFIGLDVLRHVCASYPKTRVVLLVESPETEHVVNAFQGGCRGVFCRSDSFDRLRKCISTVHQGQIWVNNSQLEFILKALCQAHLLRIVDAKGNNLLSPRETQVSLLVAEGLTNREISHRLNLTEHTVRNYLFRIFEKLGISNRVELVLYTISQYGLESQKSQQAV